MSCKVEECPGIDQPRVFRLRIVVVSTTTAIRILIKPKFFSSVSDLFLGARDSSVPCEERYLFPKKDQIGFYFSGYKESDCV